MKLNINTNATVNLTNRLEKMKRSALPNAIRGALNATAFDVKQRTMPASASANFINRSPNFFKANSKVEKATGWDIDTMKATVAFKAGKGKGADWAVEDLEEQEKGGKIKGKSFIPTTIARGGSPSRNVRPSNRLTGMKNIVNSNTLAGRNAKQKFRYAAAKAGPGGFVLGNNNKKTLWKIESIRDGVIKKKPMYSYRAGRSVSVRGTKFMEKACLESAARMEYFYSKEAKRQFDKA